MRRFWQRERSMRRELSSYILGLALATALIFVAALIEYFESGLDKAQYAGILMEVRSFEREYAKNPDTPLPTSYSTHFYLDNWDQAPEFYKQVIPFEELEVGEFAFAEHSPHGVDEWDDSRYMLAYWHRLADGRDLFVVNDFEGNMFTSEERAEFDEYFFRVFYLGGGYLLLMLLVVWFYNWRINRYTQQLAGWAEALTLENIAQSRPDFRYAELNRVAEQLQSAFRRIATLLEREHQFLRHASHELRTPIAVIRANMELLDKVGVPAELGRPVDRVRRANHTMLQLTETLLWLSRENEAEPKVEELRTDQLLDELYGELDYLLQDKPVRVHREYATDLVSKPLPVTPLRIVLSNLLRNAFQYTGEGEVVLQVGPESICIENRETGHCQTDSDQSFGLGLMLVQRISERMGWNLELEFNEQGGRACLIGL